MDYTEVNTIRGQYQAGLWPQFLQMVKIDGLRGWSGQAVEFNFPVVALVGENGSGKSTLMKAAACAYDNKDKERRFYPSSFFVDTHWDSIQGVLIDFRVKRGTNVDSFRITKPTKRWRVPESESPRKSRRLFGLSHTSMADSC
ncbi:AAA family ATPase [Dokdonella sp.]|uniref:AAA family ATPase n=1 Tax=Dokdonella sp. TaxID=2291710 RepID=UPI003784C5E2